MGSLFDYQLFFWHAATQDVFLSTAAERLEERYEKAKEQYIAAGVSRLFPCNPRGCAFTMRIEVGQKEEDVVVLSSRRAHSEREDTPVCCFGSDLGLLCLTCVTKGIFLQTFFFFCPQLLVP